MLNRVDVKQVSDVIWEIPPSFKQGMNVPARIYATKELLDGMDNGVFEQVTNVASLPGIMRYSYAMADAHWGYGFPIGGVAAFDLEKGVISPGGIGFDVNCLHPDSRILDKNGAWHRIADCATIDHLRTLDEASRKLVDTRSVAFLRRHEGGSLLHIRTALGKEILVTEDHPLLTHSGMKPAGELAAGDELVSTGFEGVKYTRPSTQTLVPAESMLAVVRGIKAFSRGNAVAQIMNQLRKRGLVSVSADGEKLPMLLKLLGSVFGDGTIPRLQRGAYTTFYGRVEDLLRIKEDIKSLGFESAIYRRKRHHRIRTVYGISEFDFTEFSLAVQSSSFSVLLLALGAPYGKKASSRYSVPGWLHSLEPWQKRLFLAAYFGAELSKPTTANGYNFTGPSFSVNKLESLADNAIEFLGDIKRLLSSLGIQTSDPALVEGYKYDGKEGRSVGYRLSILSNTENLRAFLSAVGYAYNSEKERLASLASLYLSYLSTIRGRRDETRKKALQLYTSGVAAQSIVLSLAGKDVSESFIRHSIWSERGTPRVWGSPHFEQFCQQSEVESSGLVYDTITSVERKGYEGDVFDFTVSHASHNFIADGLIVSNCGMRLIRTNLRFAEVKPKVKELVDLLFQLVPAGVGVKGFLKLNEPQFEDIMRWGVKWCVEHDLGWEDDPSHVEEGGFIKGADPSKVSRQAISRGISQFGTLGSGNHYLEIQVVDPARHLNRELAKEFGIMDDDQVLVMIHCGSRGFGHQIGSDYLRIFDGAMKRYGIQIRDRELACAPFRSKEGQDYYGAMVCAANMAFTNRQVILQRVREAFGRVFHKDAEKLDMHLIYDVCHNVAKVEKHKYDGTSVEALVHRKGATRSFGPGHPDIPSPYRHVGQPVIIGGSMETGSYLLVGTQKAMEDTFGSTAHGSGRTMSRTAAKKSVRGDVLQKKMQERGIYVKAATMEGLAEEAGLAYKDISQVVDTMDRAGISKKVVALRPIGNIKG